MAGKLLDERISILNGILFQNNETHHTSEGTVVLLRNLTKSKTLINSIQDFFHPCKLKYVRIFEDPVLLNDLKDLGLREFKISGAKTQNGTGHSRSPSPKSLVSVLIEFDHVENLNVYTQKLSQVPNPFGSTEITFEHLDTSENQKEPRHILHSLPKISYDSIVIENMSEFIGDKKLSVSDFENFLSKFKLFGEIDSIYFPTKSKESERFDFINVGFIGFARKADLNESILECLYFLHDLTLEKFEEFNKSDIVEISTAPDNEEQSETSRSARLRLSICQKKHEPFLLNNLTGIKLDDNELQVFADAERGSSAHEVIFNRFSKTNNFQQSNIYVNNLPIVFQNDDEAWFDFWIQFGNKDSIKLAKIIKPQFYSRRQNSPYGKFGFVFYNDLKPALKAILLTNNRLVSGFADYPKFHIEASFAIQKSINERFQNNHGSLPLRQENLMLPFPYPAPHQPLPHHSLPLGYTMAPFDGQSYYGGRGSKAGSVPRRKLSSGKPQDSNPDSAEHLLLFTPPYENYYNYYMAMPYQMQANFAPNGCPQYACAPFPDDAFAYGAQYGYYPMPYHVPPGGPAQAPRKGSE